MTQTIDSIQGSQALAHASSLRARLHQIIDEAFSIALQDEDVGLHATIVQQARTDALLACLSYSEPVENEQLEERSIQVGELMLDLAGHEVFAAGRRMRLTHREFSLLRFLVRNRGRVCTREEIVVHVWSQRDLSSGRTVDIHIHRLRRKLGRPFIELVETLRNVGYKLRTSPRPQETRMRGIAAVSASMVHEQLG